ncbi:hypothetical protein DSO57_1038524 [Entomophthora muscae]|uniref:Uncharacterized protein n=1 Tax=Entomophthora muscae TaxID=34485 RepID=A0ACC2RPP7_9FUNG|nr:hypothetical protein DSO57_1038524 [Entomophthora muscae]
MDFEIFKHPLLLRWDQDALAFHPKNPTSTDERPVAFKPGFVNNSEIAAPNSFGAQGGFNNEVTTASSFEPSRYMPRYFMSNPNDVRSFGTGS